MIRESACPGCLFRPTRFAALDEKSKDFTTFLCSSGMMRFTYAIWNGEFRTDILPVLYDQKVIY